MSRDVTTLTMQMTVAEAAELLISSSNTSLPVVDEGMRLVGVLSEVDILRLSLPRYADLIGDLSFLPPEADFVSPEKLRTLTEVTVGEVMHREPLYTVREDSPLAEAALLMVQHRLGRLPVVEEGRLIGAISRRDVLRAIVQTISGEPPESS